ncbi:MAG TPA: hypothetical protein VI452_00125 [Marmoricola sp.]
MKQFLARAGAAVTAAALIGLAAGPALAAGSVAQASANAIDLTLLGNEQSTGSFTATNDGTHESTSGRREPTIGVLTGQQVLQAGTLGQDASALVHHRRGVSAACAGLAGDGATLVGVGSGLCLRGGENLSLLAGQVDLSNVQLVKSELLQGVDQQTQAALQPVLDQVFPALSDALNQALAQAKSGVTLDADAVQAVCRASRGSASGHADIANAGVNADLGGTPVRLVDLPVNPPPNTDVLVDLHKVLDAVLDGVRTDLTTTLDGQAAPLKQALDPIQQQLVDNAVAQVDKQLQPLSDNVLKIVLNEQSHPTTDSVKVTALDLQVLPVAEQFDQTVAHVRIGNVTCGPNGEAAAPPPAAPQAHPRHHAKVSVPRVIPAGEATAPETVPAAGAHTPLVAAGSLGALLVASGVAGAAAYRRRLGG